MRKVKILSSTDYGHLEKSINKLLDELWNSTGHGPIDIQLSTCALSQTAGTRYSALIYYNDGGDVYADNSEKT